MARISLIQPEDTTGDLRTTLDDIRANWGTVPNGVKVLAASPAALQGYLALDGALTAGSLSGAERERISILTAQRNECEYCLSAHTLAGRAAGLSKAELAATRQGEADEPRAAAVLGFADAVIDHRGDVPADALAAARTAGLTDAELVQTVAEVALNTFTNYANRLAETELDFPRVSLVAERNAA